jgi:hypothetical protein
MIILTSLYRSLFTSFDYLGFWLYAVFDLMAAGPLFAVSLSAKVCAITLGVYGVLFHIIIICIFVRLIPTEGIEL